MNGFPSHLGQHDVLFDSCRSGQDEQEPCAIQNLLLASAESWGIRQENLDVQGPVLALYDGCSMMAANPMVGMDICHAHPHRQSWSLSCLEGSISISSHPPSGFLRKATRLTPSLDSANRLFLQSSAMEQFARKTMSSQKYLLLCTLKTVTCLTGKFFERASVCEY